VVRVPTLSAQDKITAAVLDLEAREGVSTGIALMLSDYLRTQLVNSNRYTIVTRENMEQILREQQFQLAGCTTQECIVQMGQLLGVRKMFSGSIGKFGTTYLINMKIMDVESGKIDKAESDQCSRFGEDAVIESLRKIANRITSAAPAPAAKKEPQKPAEKPKPAPAEQPTHLEDGGFKGRMGIGGNYLDTHFRYGLSNYMLVVRKAQFDPTNMLVGGRVYLLLKDKDRQPAFFSYVGGEFSWLFSDLFTGGFETGGFYGAEFMLNRNMGLGGTLAFTWWTSGARWAA